MSKIYVSTYQKYTTGTMKGEWLDLSHYASRDDFLAACAELHSDESDPELMLNAGKSLGFASAQAILRGLICI